MACACSGPVLQPDAYAVATVTAAPNCELIADVTVVTVTTRLGVHRDGSVIKNELVVLAKNSALELDGNTIMPVSAMRSGQQTFSVYHCS